MSLQDHIADIWAALETYDKMAPDAAEDYEAFARFIVLRSFRKLAAQFDEDKLFFGGRKLSEVIRKWKPDPLSDLPPRWIPIPQSLRNVSPNLMPEEGVREVGDRVEWELSNRTVPSWAILLSSMLDTLGICIEKARAVLKRDVPIKEQSSLISDVHNWYNLLYDFIFWKHQVVPFLLKKTNLSQHLCQSMHDIDSKYSLVSFSLS